MWKEMVVVYFNTLSWHLFESTKENDDKLPSWWPVHWRLLKPGPPDH